MKNNILDKEEMFQPMCNYVPEELWDNLMYMGIYENKIFLYKHDMTRNYINVDKEGRFYIYNCITESYSEINKEEAIKNLDLVY